MNHRILTLLAGVALALNLSARAQQMHEHPSVHGMLLFGEKKIYLSHLPLFSAPHDIQAILEVSLPPELIRTLEDDRKKDTRADTLYTVVPESFAWADMLASPRPFRVVLYHGHFERGGSPIGRGVAQISRVVYAEKFKPGAAAATASEYILFGDAGERFLAHRIVAPPDFDQVLAISTSEAAGQETGSRIVKIADQPADRPLDAASRAPRKTSEGASFTVSRQIYLELDELRD